MATVTETYTLKQDEGDTTYPSAARARVQAALDSGAIVSFTKTPITVAGKTRFNFVIVYRSAEDKTAFLAASAADTELQAHLRSRNAKRINYTVS